LGLLLAIDEKQNNFKETEIDENRHKPIQTSNIQT
jgi:hypothetical protein